MTAIGHRILKESRRKNNETEKKKKGQSFREEGQSFREEGQSFREEGQSFREEELCVLGRSIHPWLRIAGWMEAAST